jgi:hypothetical protein
MPYIKKEKREEMDENITNLLWQIKTKGDLNYVICELVGRLILETGINYTNISEKIGAVHDAETELRRRILNIYEDRKLLENCDVESFNEIINNLLH